MEAPDRVEPPVEATERDMLASYLDYHRATLLRKISGVSDADLRRPMVPSGTTLLGLVKHLGWVECWWFQMNFAGREVDDPWAGGDMDADFRIEPNESTAGIIDFYRAQCAESRAVVAGAKSLDQRAARAHPRRGGGITLRWILLHMIEETARHNGHADILREMIDGATGD